MKKLLLLPALLTVSLLAQTFNVSTTPEFRTALTNAAQNGEDDTIILADGTYKTTDDGQGTFIFLDNEAHTLSLKGSDSTNVILSGDHLNQILKHNSTAKAPLLLEKLSFFDANTTELGGAVRASDDIIVTDCNISNNITTYEGGGLFTGEKVIITDSYFSNNMAYSGGAFRSGNYTEVKKSVFVENKAGTYGGGFYQFNGTTLIENSNFINNNARDGGAMLLPYNSQGALVKNSTFISNSSNGWGAAIGFFNGSGKLSVYNSIFRNNKGTNNTVINSSDATLINSLFVENSKLYISGNSSVLNSIIISTIIDGYTTSLISVTNSYINQDEVLVDSLSSNLIYSNINLGFVDEANGDYNLTASSGLIDAGTTDITGITFPTTDLNGNARIVGGSIDIGPYEFSTTRPTINSITYTGTAKEQSLLTFSVDYTLASGRAINTIEYDYANNGSWSTASTHTFNTAGTYTVNVKITDSEGEFSTTSKVVTIAALAFSDMTDEQKLIKAIDPVYYDAVVAIIETQKESANVSGYELGTYDGTQLVIATPDAYGLDVVIPLQVAEVNALPTGWSMMAVPAAITDMSIFSSVKVVWYFKDDVWRAYSPNAATTSALAVAGIATLTTLPANSAVWVEK